MNRVFLVGKISTEVEAYYQESKFGEDLIYTTARFRLFSMHIERRHRVKKVALDCRLGGEVAKHALKLELEKGDYVLLEGHLRQSRFKGRKGHMVTHVYVEVERFQALWPPPRALVRGHVLLPADEVRRLRALTRNMDEFEVADEVLDKFGFSPVPEAEADVHRSIPEADDSE